MNFLAFGLEIELSWTLILVHIHSCPFILCHSACYGGCASETFSNNVMMTVFWLVTPKRTHTHTCTSKKYRGLVRK